MDNRGKEQRLVNMVKAQKKLATAIDKFAQVELIKAEEDKLREKQIKTIWKPILIILK